MAKNKNNSEPKTKKGPDLTAQKVKKAKRALKSGGKRGLNIFLSQHPDIKGHTEVKALLAIASKLPDRKPKGKRGPKSPETRKQQAEQPEMQTA